MTTQSVAYQGPIPRHYSPAQTLPSQPPSQPPSALPQVTSPTKEVNTAMLCRYGQETVQDIVAKAQDIFTLLKTIQLPSGTSTSTQQFQERKTKLDEQLKNINLTLFKKLRVIHDKVNENCASMECFPPEKMIPMLENEDDMTVYPQDTDAVRFASKEHREVVELVRSRNCQLKEVIDQLRTVVWEINTMMAMRKT